MLLVKNVIYFLASFLAEGDIGEKTVAGWWWLLFSCTMLSFLYKDQATSNIPLGGVLGVDFPFASGDGFPCRARGSLTVDNTHL